MILKGSFLSEALVREVCARVSPNEPFCKHPGNDDVGYIGAGYWRYKLVRDEVDDVKGLRLINPDRTAEEIEAVERGVAVLIRAEYSKETC